VLVEQVEPVGAFEQDEGSLVLPEQSEARRTLAAPGERQHLPIERRVRDFGQAQRLRRGSLAYVGRDRRNIPAAWAATVLSTCRRSSTQTLQANGPLVPVGTRRGAGSSPRASPSAWRSAK
jgi:hypothetical protein